MRFPQFITIQRIREYIITGRTDNLKILPPRGKDFQIISPASDYVFSYSLNGDELWKSHYPGGYSVVPRPVFSGNMVFVSSGYDRPTLYAINTDGKGDVTSTKVV